MNCLGFLSELKTLTVTKGAARLPWLLRSGAELIWQISRWKHSKLWVSTIGGKQSSGYRLGITLHCCPEDRARERSSWKGRCQVPCLPRKDSVLSHQGGFANLSFLCIYCQREEGTVTELCLPIETFQHTLFLWRWGCFYSQRDTLTVVMKCEARCALTVFLLRTIVWIWEEWYICHGGLNGGNCTQLEQYDIVGVAPHSLALEPWCSCQHLCFFSGNSSESKV